MFVNCLKTQNKLKSNKLKNLKSVLFLLIIFLHQLGFSQEFEVCKSEKNDKFALCKFGTPVTSYSYDSIVYLKDNFYRAYEKNKIGILDYRAQLILETEFDSLIYFPQGKNFFVWEDKKLSLIDSLGEFTVKNFEVLLYFSDSSFVPYSFVNKLDLDYPFMYIKSDQNTGVINSDGFLIQSVTNDFVWVQRNSRNGGVNAYLTMRNNAFYAYNVLLTPFKYFVLKDVVGVLENGTYLIKDDKDYKVTNSEGNIINYIQNQVQYAMLTNAKWVFVNSNGSLVSDVEYDFIERVYSGNEMSQFKAYLETKILQFDKDGKLIEDR